MRFKALDLTSEKATWASDFQVYNPECLERVRLWLIKNSSLTLSIFNRKQSRKR